jgi:methyl-accepting chemotaxis protein
MDQVTQQNAAMVEEANAAGATLANEAGRLRELIGGFQLGDGANSHVSAQRSPARRAPAVSAASSYAAPVSSPARSMVGKIANAFRGKGGGSAAAAPSNASDSWEEF